MVMLNNIGKEFVPKSEVHTIGEKAWGTL